MENFNTHLHVTPDLDKSEKAQVFKSEWDSIISKSVTVDNINTYSEDVLGGLVSLTGGIVEDYKKTKDGKSLGATLEDEAYKAYGLPPLGDTLLMAQEKADSISSIDALIHEKIQLASYVITPTDTGTTINTTGSGEGLQRKDVLPRLKTLLYILTNDFNLSLDDILLFEGRTNENMVRKEPYIRVQVKSINRLVYICDEAENISYIFDLEKVRENNVSIEDIDVMTKGQRNSLIDNIPNIGKRIVQSVYWREYIVDTLSNPIISENSKSDIITENYNVVGSVSKSELDLWRGFWTDPETGKHWGNPFNIAIKSGIFSNTSIYRILKRKKFMEQYVADSLNRASVAYCFEDVINDSDIALIKDSPSAEISGEWAGFYTDDEKKHWGSINKISQKLLKSRIWINERLDNTSNKKKIRDENGRLRDAYCIEDIMVSSGNALFELPETNLEGEWGGYHTDEKGVHWGPIELLCEKIGVSRHYLENLCKNKNTINILSRNNKLIPAYSYEDIVEGSELKKFLSITKMNGEGDWKGFYIDPNDEHFGTINAISSKLGIGKRTVASRVKAISPKMVRTDGDIREVYSLEQVKSIL